MSSRTHSLSPHFKFIIEKKLTTVLRVLTPFLHTFNNNFYGGMSFLNSIDLAAKSHPEASFFIDFNSKDGPIKVRDELIYMPSKFHSLAIVDEKKMDPYSIGESEQDVLNIINAIYNTIHGKVSFSEVEELIPKNAFIQTKKSKFDFSKPGIYRLQHACLLFRSPEKCILIDPHFHSLFEPNTLTENILFSDLPKIDAVLISHGHGDHYSLATLSLFDRETQIIFPKVEKETLICPNFEVELRKIGFTNLCPVEWDYRAIEVGDMTIHPAPFYGEQPTPNEKPYRADVLNHGVTYLINFCKKTSWVIVDSGDDYRGSMIDVAEEVCDRFGPIDFVFSNMKDFFANNTFFIDGGPFWLSLSPNQMEKLPERKKSITLGVDGLSKLMNASKAKCIYPYAHWWVDIGNPIQKEHQLVQSLSKLISAKVGQWNVGERVEIS